MQATFSALLRAVDSAAAHLPPADATKVCKACNMQHTPCNIVRFGRCALAASRCNQGGKAAIQAKL
jgi:hypothetical protein